MSDPEELRYRINALERDLANYHDALEQHLYDAEVSRVERGHGWVTTISFVGSLGAAIALFEWLDVDMWLIKTVGFFVVFFALFAFSVALTEKPMKREIDKIRKPLSWLPKPSWREKND